MRQICLISIMLLIFVLTMPIIALRSTIFDESNVPISSILANRQKDGDIEPDGAAVEASVRKDPSPTPSQAPSPSPEPENPDRVTLVSVLSGGAIKELYMDEYLVGVIAAEMPASFPEEALRAQAVASRTNTLYKMRQRRLLKTDGRHPDADVCADSSHCEAYISMDAAREKWGQDADLFEAKILDAVQSTAGLVALYDNEPISAVFHAASSGTTERSADVWGKDLPYLQSVKSPGESDSPRYYGRVEIDAEKFKADFLAAHADAKLEGKADSWLKNERRSAAGGIETIEVGSVTVKGSELRMMFGLASTNFRYSVEDGKLIFKTTGYGHGVGMSQYGARALALEGKDFEEIIKWYYSGVAIGTYLS